MHWIKLPFVALIEFYEVSPGGAMGVLIGVGGCVGAPFIYWLLGNKLPNFVVFPIAAFFGVLLAGITTALFTGMMEGAVPTHDMALTTLNNCDAATKILGTPIESTSVGGGTYRSEGDMGNSSWSMKLKGPEGKARLNYAMEKHGGEWTFTKLNMRRGKRTIKLRECYQRAP